LGSFGGERERRGSHSRGGNFFRQKILHALPYTRATVHALPYTGATISPCVWAHLVVVHASVHTHIQDVHYLKGVVDFGIPAFSRDAEPEVEDDRMAHDLWDLGGL
jgi:hypothetical protein